MQVLRSYLQLATFRFRLLGRFQKEYLVHWLSHPPLNETAGKLTTALKKKDMGHLKDVPNNHILTQNLYYNYYYPNPKYLIIGYMDPLGLFHPQVLKPTHGQNSCVYASLPKGSAFCRSRPAHVRRGTVLKMEAAVHVPVWVLFFWRAHELRIFGFMFSRLRQDCAAGTPLGSDLG